MSCILVLLGCLLFSEINNDPDDYVVVFFKTLVSCIWNEKYSLFLAFSSSPLKWEVCLFACLAVLAF